MIGSYYALKNNYTNKVFLIILIPSIILILISFFSTARGGSVIASFALLWFVLNFFFVKRKIRSVLGIFGVFIVSLPLLTFVFTQSLVIYNQMAESGSLGENARIRAEREDVRQLGVLGLLLTVRTELPSSLAAIADSPYLGHGSYPRDPEGKYDLELMRRLIEVNPDIAIPKTFSPSPQIRTHSYLFGSWVEAGIMGGMFWVYYLFFVNFVFIKIINKENYLNPLFFILWTLAMWCVFFNGYDTAQRLNVAITFSIGFLLLKDLHLNVRKGPFANFPLENKHKSIYKPYRYVNY
jgi:O-antigen ligase